MGQKICIHANQYLKHQIEYAGYLKSGFARHGLNAEITFSIDTEADIHVVQGPHFAKDRWLNHSRTILLDRAYWGDPLFVSLGWLNAKGGRDFAKDCSGDRPKPELRPWKGGGRVICVADYGDSTSNWMPLMDEAAGKFGQEITYRPHPADTQDEMQPLWAQLLHYKIAIGYRTTALVDAAIYGLSVICFSDQNIVWDVSSHSINEPLFKGDRTQWLNNVSYANWHKDEIASGAAWDYLCRLR